MRVTSSICDICRKPAIMTREIQGKFLDLCSAHCAHVALDRDLERQGNELAEIERMGKAKQV